LESPSRRWSFAFSMSRSFFKNVLWKLSLSMHYYFLSPHDASPEINTYAQNACKQCRFWKINHRTPEHLSRNRKIIQCSHEKFSPILRQIMGNSRHKIPSSASRNKPKIPSSMPSKQSMHGIKESPRHHVLNSTLSARESERG